MNDRDLHARACDLFLELRAQDQAKRDAALEALAAEGDEARALAHEVRSLLRYDHEPEPATSAAPPLSMPTHLGPYRIIEPIGRGGSGHVFLAEQTEPVRRRVAIKVVPEAAVDADLAARFQVERRALERTVHPNVVRLIDAGRTPEGLPYLVMDFVAGEPITRHCQRAALPLDACVRLLMAVADGVQHAHQRGVIHRDLKPANVVVTEVGGRATPIVLDFGIARRIGKVGEGAGHDAVATSGWPVGTPASMAPEQAGFGEIDTRVDVYALGALLYELIAGHPPIPVADDLATTFARLRDFVPPPPSRARRDLERNGLAPTADALLRDLDAIALRALEKAPERRYPTVAALRADLERALSAEPIEARPATWRYQLNCFARREKRLVGSLALLVLAVLTVLVSLTWDLFAVEEQRRVAQAERDTQEELNRFLTDDLFGAASPDRSGTDVRALTLLQRASPGVDERFADRPLVAAAIHHGLGEVFAQVEDFERAETHLARAFTLRQAHAGVDAAATLTTEIARASLLARRQCFVEAEQAFATLMPRARRGLAADDPFLLAALNDRAVSLMSLARTQEAIPLLEESLAGRRRLFGDASWLTFSTESNLALATGETAPPERSLATLRALLERARTLSAPPRYTILGLHNNVGATLLDLGRPAEARPHLAAALDLVNGLLDADHASVLQIRANLASLDADLGQPEHGFTEYQDIAERFARTLGPRAEDTLHARHGMWSCAVKAGRWNDAAAGFEKLLDDVVASVSAGHPLVAQTQHSLANALRRDGRLAAALPHARAAAAAFLASYGAEHPRSKGTAVLVAEIESALSANGVR